MEDHESCDRVREDGTRPTLLERLKDDSRKLRAKFDNIENMIALLEGDDALSSSVQRLYEMNKFR